MVMRHVMIGLLAASTMAIACKKKAEDHTAPPAGTQNTAVAVENVKLGTAVGNDKRVQQTKDEFKPNDTIYVSVETKGTAPEATVTARWKFGNEQVVSETSQRVTPKDAMATEFHIQKPDGWPTGDYHVDILVNGEKVATKDFEVKAGT